MVKERTKDDKPEFKNWWEIWKRWIVCDELKMMKKNDE